MSYSILPTWPLLLFGIIEPVLLTWAWITNLLDPSTYYITQDPSANSISTSVPSQAISVSLQIGNVMLLLAFMAVICCWTTHPGISKRYLVAVAIADVGHVYAVYAALGEKVFWDVGRWNDMVWGNVGVSVFLNVNRWATVLGLFGKIGGNTRGGAVYKNK